MISLAACAARRCAALPNALARARAGPGQSQNRERRGEGAFCRPYTPPRQSGLGVIHCGKNSATPPWPRPWFWPPPPPVRVGGGCEGKSDDEISEMGGERLGSMSEIAFHEKAGRSQGDSCGFSLNKSFSLCRVATDAILPSALSGSELFRSVQVGRSRFSRCCHLFVDLFFSTSRSWPRRLTQSPELGLGLSFFSESS